MDENDDDWKLNGCYWASVGFLSKYCIHKKQVGNKNERQVYWVCLCVSECDCGVGWIKLKDFVVKRILEY